MVRVIDPVMSADAFGRLVAACERFPGYTPTGTGSNARQHLRRASPRASSDRTAGPRPDGAAPLRQRRFAPGLGDRVDAKLNYLDQGGLGRDPDDPSLRFRHSYFRESLIDRSGVYAPGLEEYLASPTLARAARRLYGARRVVPWSVYANLMLPGQELGVHTDVPEFRGAHRGTQPLWLLCAMHLSGLFKDWRRRIATAITYVSAGGSGGALLCYPDGPGGPARRIPALPNSAVLLDADSVFHGVERVSSSPDSDDLLQQLTAESQLVPRPDGRWSLRSGSGREIALYERDEVRLSVSWKAWCPRTAPPARDPSGSEAPAAAKPPLTTERIVATFVDELVARGRLASADHRLSEEELGMLVIDEFIRFPTAVPS